MSEPVCRWGVLGTANIARKNWKAIRLAGNAVLTAVASRDAGRANQFIAECQAETPFAASPVGCTYDDLLDRSDVDAVYIPLPTGIRREWVVKAAEAGKHVLCEKPCGPTAADVRAMVEACKKNRVQFMDGVMFMHSARLPLLRQVLDDGTSVGEIRRIASQFTFAAPAAFLTGNIRVKPDLEPLGALGDLGWYNIRFSLWTMKYQMPEAVTGRIIHAQDGVPLEFAGELIFPGGASAGFDCSFRTELQQWAHVSGTKGAVEVPDFVLSYYGCEASFVTNTPVFHVVNTRYHWESHPKRHAVREYSDGHPTAQESNMVRTFSNLVTSRHLDPAWGEIALKTQLVLDACLTSARDGGRPAKVAE